MLIQNHHLQELWYNLKKYIKGGGKMGQALKLNNLTYLERVHGNSKGWINKATKYLNKYEKEKWSQWHYLYDDLKELDLIDNIVPEPLGGAHRNYVAMAQNLKARLIADLADLDVLDKADLLDRRYQRLMSYGYC